MNWVDIIALLLSAVAAGFSIWSFFVERKRNRREATIHAFEELEKTVFLQDDYTSAPAEAKKEAEEHTATASVVRSAPQRRTISSTIRICRASA